LAGKQLHDPGNPVVRRETRGRETAREEERGDRHGVTKHETTELHVLPRPCFTQAEHRPASRHDDNSELDTLAAQIGAESPLEHIPLKSIRFERNMLQLSNLKRFLVDRVHPPGGQAL
jgi:hypothetical protein